MIILNQAGHKGASLDAPMAPAQARFRHVLDPLEEFLRIIVWILAFALAASSMPASSQQRNAAAVNDAPILTVRMSNFAFDPDHLRLKAGIPVRLRLTNESSGGHDFSAPEFFAASGFPPGSSAPPDGAVAVGSRQTVEIVIVPHTPGAYRVECTHFLHSLFGMHGTVEVVP
jgi:plastocyanin